MHARPVVLILAKAPVPGLVKTRLIPDFTAYQAAALAAAALLDTLDTSRAAARVAGAEVVVALAGDLREAANAPAMREALRQVRVVPQRGDGLAQRLAHAHVDAAGPDGTTFQIGMDTPQVSEADIVEGLRRVVCRTGPGALLGPADDGGWWALALRRASVAGSLRSVEMSTSRTGATTLAAISEHVDVEFLRSLRDVDTLADVEAVGARHDGRFGELARALSPSVRTSSPARLPSSPAQLPSSPGQLQQRQLSLLNDTCAEAS